MYERARFLRNRSIRNGIAGILFSAFFINFTQNDYLNPALHIIPIATLAWMFYGFWLRSKLKLKDSDKDDFEISDDTISYKQVHFLFTVAVIILIFLIFKYKKYADYIAIPIVVTYTWWLITQIKKVNKYLST